MPNLRGMELPQHYDNNISVAFIKLLTPLWTVQLQVKMANSVSE